MGKFKSKSKRNTKRQKLYKMKGCSKQNRKSKSKKSKTKKYRGGNENTNNLERAFPNTGPVMLEGELGTPFLNSQGNQRGGNCGCGLPAMSGGRMRGGNGTGFVGQPWSGSPSDWPGVDGISGNRNYLAQNNFPTDPQTEMISTGAQPPFLGGRGKNKKRQKGGSFSNFLAQDLINFGRQFQYGLGTTYNALAGYSAPVNPLPWKDQMMTNRPLKANI